MNRRLSVIALTALAAASLAACGSPPSSSAAAPAGPSPASIAAALGCQLNGPDVSPQDAYDTTAYESLSAQGSPTSLCSVGSGTAADVIMFASEAKETDWLHQNDLAESQQFASGFSGLVTGNLWVVTDGGGVVGLDDIAKALAPLGGKESTSF